MSEIPDYIVGKAAQALSCLNDKNWSSEGSGILKEYKSEAIDTLEAAHYGELLEALEAADPQIEAAVKLLCETSRCPHDTYDTIAMSLGGAGDRSRALLAKIKGETE